MSGKIRWIPLSISHGDRRARLTALRRIWQFIVDKIIEAIIFALIAVLGGSYLM